MDSAGRGADRDHAIRFEGPHGQGRGRFAIRGPHQCGGCGANHGGQGHPQLPDRERSVGLGQYIDGSRPERFERGMGRGSGQGTDDDDRQGVMLHQFAEECKAVHARHFDIERQHVGLQGQDLIAGDERVGGGADHFHIAFGRDDSG
jgi:hypothetical protein